MTTYVNGEELVTPIGVFAYLSTPATTTVTTSGTYYDISGTFTNAPMEKFVLDGGIKYKGTRPRYFEVDWHASVDGNSNGMTIHLGIKKNGTLVSSSVMGTFLKTANEPQALSGTTVVELDEDDVITLVLTSDGNGDIVNVEHFTTTIRGFFV